MSIYRRVENLLLRRFNAENGQKLLPEHVRFTNPRSAALVDEVMANTYNTAVTMEMTPASPFDGAVTLFYGRVVLSSEFALSKLINLNFIKVKSEKTIHELLPYINTKLGLHLRPVDVIDGSLNDGGIFTQVRIQTTNTSMEFTGSFDIGIMRVDATLVSLDVKHSVVYTEDTGRRGVYPGRLEHPVFPLTYDIDYSPAYFDLKRVKVPLAWGAFPAAYILQAVTPGAPAHLASVLSTIDGIAWRSDTAAGDTLTLMQAMPVYNGPTKDCLVPSYAYFGITAQPMSKDIVWSNPSNLEYDNVLVLMIHNPWYHKTRYKSLALFHYNEGRK